jgi:F420-non-reducing hydrogenase iron-sulfur subunit
MVTRNRTHTEVSERTLTSAADWFPEIIAFCCNWCAYAGADLAGVNRRQYASEVKILRVMCSGRVSQGMILRAFASGADGVIVLGCHPGDCHYASGNRQAESRVPNTQELLDLVGVEPSRLMLQWISAAEGQLFAATMDEFVARIRELGPVGGGVRGN